MHHKIGFLHNSMMIHVLINAFKLNDSPLESQGLWQMNLLKIFSQTGIANFLAKQQGLPDGNWVLISPVHCQTTHNDAMIIGSCQELEWQSAMDVYYDHFVKWMSQDGISVHRVLNQLWLMDAKGFPDLKSLSLNDMQHRSLQPHLSKFPPMWLKWWTEIQMVLHEVKGHGPYAVNAVWPWGAGSWSLKGPIFVMSKNHLYSELLKVGVPVEVWKPNVQLKGHEVFLVDAQEQSLLEKHPLRAFPSHWHWLDTDEEKTPQTIWNTIKGLWKREH